MSQDEYTDTDRIVDAINSLDLPGLRDRFAMAALQSLMVIDQPQGVTTAAMAKAAYAVADEMMKARET